MKNKYVIRLILIGLFIFLLGSSCSNINLNGNSDGQNNEESEISRDESDIIDRGPVKGGILQLFSTYPDTLDPVLTKNTYIQKYAGLVYESMVKLGKDQQAVPWVADDWSVSDDGYTWTFHIREGVNWQDGFPLTAWDVGFTIDTIMSSESDSIYKYNVSNIESYKISDDNTIVITLKKPNSFTAELMTFPIVPKRFFTKSNMNDAYKTKFPPGTGPYSISSYEEETGIVLKASRSWWYKKVSGNQDIPYISEIQIKFFKFSAEKLNVFQMGIVDAVKIDSQHLGKYVYKPDIVIKKYVSNKFDFLVLNMSNVYLKNKDVRRAIASAVNRNEIIQSILGGNAVPSDLPIIPGSWIYSYTENDQGNELQDKSRERAGAVSSYGINARLEILVNQENETRVKVAEKISEQLKSIGINCVVKKAEWKEVLNLVRRNKYDIALLGCTVPSIPDISYLYSSWYLPYHVTSTDSVTYNIAGFNNMQINEYINRMFAENNTETRKKLLSDIKGIIDDEVPYIGLYFYCDAMLYDNGVRGNLDPYTWNEYNNVAEWYITGQREAN